MFGFFTYPQKVHNRLYKLGWRPDTVPPISNIWLQLIHTLRKNGVSPDDAATLLDGALQGDRASLRAVSGKAGLFGLMYFGNEETWDQHPEAFRRK
ncbi:hypothetical protein [Sphingomonas sp.]|jgi:hypothetical protein|uniref:hypothetical protein n=1 Tax=Sphingomonas sp. TaxID=28214 RepID=UPI002DF19482|nr:hypothetical protein [Sphingomonas sp.]